MRDHECRPKLHDEIYIDDSCPIGEAQKCDDDVCDQPASQAVEDIKIGRQARCGHTIVATPDDGIAEQLSSDAATTN